MKLPKMKEKKIVAMELPKIEGVNQVYLQHKSKTQILILQKAKKSTQNIFLFIPSKTY